MAFNRLVEIIIVTGGTSTIVSGLDVEFKVKRTATLSDNTAQVVIYNANDLTRKQIIKESSSIIIKAGYADQNGLSVIFIGQIFTVDTQKDGVDWVTTITALSKQKESDALEYKTVSLSYGNGTTMSTIIKALAVEVGLAVFGAENVSNLSVYNFVFVGTVRNALQDCNKILQDNGAMLYIDNNELIICNTGSADSRYSAINLDYTTGLLEIGFVEESDAAKEIKVQNKKRIKFKALLISELQPRGVIVATVDNVKGAYIIEQLEFSGNNFGSDEFYVIGEAAA